MIRRAAIRLELLATLAALPSAPLVSSARGFPYRLDELPAINVRTGAEGRRDDWTTQQPAPKNREIVVMRCEYVLELRAVGTGGEEAALDALELEIAQALNADRTLNGTANQFIYLGSGVPDLGDELELDVQVRELDYAAEYRIDLADPQALEV